MPEEEQEMKMLLGVPDAKSRAEWMIEYWKIHDEEWQTSWIINQMMTSERSTFVRIKLENRKWPQLLIRVIFKHKLMSASAGWKFHRNKIYLKQNSSKNTFYLDSNSIYSFRMAVKKADYSLLPVFKLQSVIVSSFRVVFHSIPPDFWAVRLLITLFRPQRNHILYHLQDEPESFLTCQTNSRLFTQHHLCFAISQAILYLVGSRHSNFFGESNKRQRPQSGLI